MSAKWLAALLLGLFIVSLGGDSMGAGTKKPDLKGSIVKLTPGKTLTRGKSFTITGKVINAGLAPAVGKITVKASAKGTTIISCTQAINLKPGKSALFTYSGKVPRFAPKGKYTISLKVDSTNVIKESNELNNTVLLGTITIK